METTTVEIADGIHRISTFVPDPGIPFNQYLVVADEPLLFHTGPRQLFPLVSAAVGRVIPVETLRWITFGHVEADECGSMNNWLEAAPPAQVAHGMTAVMVSLNDLADRPPRGSRTARSSTSGASACVGSTRRTSPTVGKPACCSRRRPARCSPATSSPPPVKRPAVRTPTSEPAIAGEAMFHATALTPATAPTIRRLADLDVKTLALMHGPAFTGPGAAAIEDWPPATPGWSSEGLAVARPGAGSERIVGKVSLFVNGYMACMRQIRPVHGQAAVLCGPVLATRNVSLGRPDGVSSQSDVPGRLGPVKMSTHLKEARPDSEGTSRGSHGSENRSGYESSSSATSSCRRPSSTSADGQSRSRHRNVPDERGEAGPRACRLCHPAHVRHVGSPSIRVRVSPAGGARQSALVGDSCRTSSR